MVWLIGAALGCSTYEVAECSKNTDCKSEEYCDDGECKKKATSGGGVDCSMGNDCNACVTCANASVCATALAACEQRTTCLAAHDCFSQCSLEDAACITYCKEAHSEGYFYYNAWITCVICDACAASCGSSAQCSGGGA